MNYLHPSEIRKLPPLPKIRQTSLKPPPTAGHDDQRAEKKEGAFGEHGSTSDRSENMSTSGRSENGERSHQKRPRRRKSKLRKFRTVSLVVAPVTPDDLGVDLEGNNDKTSTVISNPIVVENGELPSNAALSEKLQDKGSEVKLESGSNKLDEGDHSPRPAMRSTRSFGGKFRFAAARVLLNKM